MSSSNKNSALSLRINAGLKEKLQKIAKKKDKSLNDMSSQIFVEFVEKQEQAELNAEKIPRAEELITLIEQQENKIIDKSRQKLKIAIKDMIKNAYSSLACDVFKGINATQKQKDIALKALTRELKELGYFTHVFKHKITHNSIDVDVDYLAISTNQEDLEGFIEAENTHKQHLTDC